MVYYYLIGHHWILEHKLELDIVGDNVDRDVSAFHYSNEIVMTLLVDGHYL